jgi:hypothetical protein
MLARQFPTHRNREFIAPLQGIKLGDQGIYSPDQGIARRTCCTCVQRARGYSVKAGPAKMEGRKIMPPKPPEPTKPSDLMEALRQSAHNDSKARAEKRKTAPRKTTLAASRLMTSARALRTLWRDARSRCGTCHCAFGSDPQQRGGWSWFAGRRAILDGLADRDSSRASVTSR